MKTPVPTTGPATVASRLASRANNFDALRLVAAMAVVLSHAYPLTYGNDALEPYARLSGHPDYTLGRLAVGAFFIMSGMLVARSYLLDPSAGRFLRKRVVRIFPGLIACVALCVVVLGAIFTTLPLTEYVRHRETVSFARNAILLPNHYTLPGVFADFGPTDPRRCVNGSLWSLPAEFLMYLAVLSLGTLKLLRRPAWIALLCAVALAAWAFVAFHGIPPTSRLWKHKIWVEYLPQLTFLFFAGTLLLLYAERVRIDWRLFAACLLAIALGWHHRFGPALLTICMPYVIIYLAFARIPLIGKALLSAAAWGDFSYGVYLYGYPVEQVLIRTLGGRLPFAAIVVLACIGATLMAAVSWHVVEKQALRLKAKSSRTAGAVRGEVKPVHAAVGISARLASEPAK